MSTFSFVTSLVKEKINSLKSGSSAPVTVPDEASKGVENDIFSNIQKATILQEAKCFNDSQINDKKCRLLLSRLIYLINKGEKFLEAESSSLFFSITKLFQSNNYDLRRMIYLIIKELRNESSIYIITSSLTKDMNSKIDLFRMNALRTIPIIIDPTNLLQVERYIKNAIISKNDGISNSALLAGFHIFPQNSELVKKWTNEVMEKLTTENQNNHYHALILLHEIKRKDKMSFIKVLTNLTKDNNLNSIATVQLIRFIKEVLLNEEIDTNIEKGFLDYLNRQVHKTNEIIVFEACKTLCELPNLSNTELTSCLATLQIFLLSTCSVNKFASLKLINKLISNPIRSVLITNSNDIEAILTDNNRSLTSLAITILLKICKQENVDKLLSQIFEYLNDISDEFKIDIVQSTKGLIKRSPKKYKSILLFLQNCMRGESKVHFKKNCIEKIEYIINEVPEGKETALLSLAEYAEDCQFVELHLYILNILNKHLLNETTAPTKYVRYIFNRVNLECNEVRASALGSLGKLALRFQELRDNIKSILKNVLNDHDEEVRERARYYLICLKEIESEEKVIYDCIDPIKIIENPININDIDILEQYIHNNMELLQNSDSIELLSESKIQEYATENKLTKKIQEEFVAPDYLNVEAEKSVEIDQKSKISLFDNYYKIFSEHAVFTNYGPLRKIGQSKELSDKKAEYIVEVQKFFFEAGIILEFKIENTLANILLKNVSVDITFTSEDLKVFHLLNAPEIKPQKTSNIFVGIVKNPKMKLVTTNITSFLKFEVNEINLTTKAVLANYEDEFQLEDFEISLGDYVAPLTLINNTFTLMWESLNGTEEEETYQLQYKTLESAIKGLSKHFSNMSVCEESDVVSQGNIQTLKLAGIFLGQTKALVQCLIGLDSKLGCVLKLKVRCLDEILRTNLKESIA